MQGHWRGQYDKYDEMDNSNYSNCSNADWSAQS